MKNINNAEMKVKDMRTTTLNDVRPINRIPALLVGMQNSFQRQGAGKLNAIYHFTFTGEKVAEATVGIREGTIKIENGLNGDWNIDVVADGETWLGEGKKPVLGAAHPKNPLARQSQVAAGVQTLLPFMRSRKRLNNFINTQKYD
jgi:hypothetical protein